MTQDPNDAKAQAKGQVGFIDLFCKPLFGAMASVVDGPSRSLSLSPSLSSSRPLPLFTSPRLLLAPLLVF